MGDFPLRWLALREPADVAARAAPIADAVAATLAYGADRLGILDLATGTGSNARALVDRLGRPQDWLLVDREPALLGQVASRMGEWTAANGLALAGDEGRLHIAGTAVDCRIATAQRDLSSFDGLSDIFAGRSLVTASALLDLVSEPWLSSLADRCRAEGAAVLFALTYDGRIRCTPEEPEDEDVRALVNRHQRTDKGFGQALGPSAVDAAGRYFVERGYVVRRAQSDWALSRDSGELQTALIVGWAEAACSIAPEQSGTVARWRARRLAHVEQGRSQIVVGHQDIAGWLAR